MWFADWRKIKIISFKKAYKKFTTSILISHISNLFLEVYHLNTHISHLKSILEVYHLNTHISHLKSIKQEKPILLGDGLFLFYNAYAPNCTRLKAVTFNPLATESKN